MVYSLETTNLSHAFSKTDPVLHSVDLKVPKGSIYGFLGPNGAGKTTTLKLLVGLLNRQKGDISILGRPLRNDRLAILRQLGCLIETPSLYGHLTARPKKNTRPAN